jgi:hypothetical protein
MKNFKQFLDEKGRCWPNYKPVPGKKAFSKGSCKKEEVELTETHLVHVNDGSKYNDEPHPEDTKHVMSGAKKYNGEVDSVSDKGAFFKFQSKDDAENFKKHVNKCPHRSCDAEHIKEEVEKMSTVDRIKKIRKEKLKEEMYDHEKEDKSVQTYGKKPKLQTTKKEDSFGENKPEAALTMSGGTTLTGTKRDEVEIDPMMKRDRPGQPDVTNKKR